MEPDDRIKSVRDDLPPAFQPVYAGSFRYFNPVQSTTFNTAFHTASNMVVAAPTGAGKTGVLELAILHMLRRYISPQGTFQLQPGTVKAVYLAPSKALVQEKVADWNKRFSAVLGVTCRELTGDTDAVSDAAELNSADIICTTPEKFDTLTRKRKEQGGMAFFSEIALVLIDEVHLLNESRGAALEAGCISRIRMVSQLPEMKEFPIARARFVAVSATIPNASDIAEWLSVDPTFGLHVFGEDYRPVRLSTHVRGYNMTKTDFLFERRLNDHLFGIIAEFSKGKPTLVFCSSRKGTCETANHLQKDGQQHASGGAPSAFVHSPTQHQRLQEVAGRVEDKGLKTVLPSGVAFHNASLSAADRFAVEQLFLHGDLPVLCTTTTLALGVNLPAHLVVVKSTRRWTQNGGGGGASGYEEYDRASCLQMLGRAGRPQFDTEGVAVIMTDRKNVHRYEALSAGAETVESQLKDALVEHLNAELTLGTIRDVSQAVAWIETTFLFVRMTRNPGYYGLQLHTSDPAAVKGAIRDKFINTALKQLAEHGLVSLAEDGLALEPQPPGAIMAHHCIQFATMVQLSRIPSHANIPSLLALLARSAELAHIHIRRGEKKPLNAINTAKGDHAVRFWIPDASKPSKAKERVSSAAEKIVILVNEALNDNPQEGLLDFSMRNETEQILSVGKRVAACMAK